MKQEKSIKKEIISTETMPTEIIKLALSSGANLDQIEKLLTLQERWDVNNAKKAYSNDMVEVHKNIVSVAKTLVNPQTHSKYASLDKIICETKKIYTEYGFSILFYEGEPSKEAHIRICADVIHKLGHKETYHYDVPLDGKGIKGNVNMTSIHAKASSTSYARRYLMCMIWNIPTGDDNDGNNNIEEKIDENKLKIIQELLVELKVDEAKFFKYINIKKLEDMPKSSFLKAKTALEATKAKRKNGDK